MQCPAHVACSETEGKFSRMMESMRKDVEVTFGILKGRFRILKYGFRLSSEKDIDNVVHACCTLHNMLLKWDGLDIWERGVDYMNDDGHVDVDILARILSEDGSRANSQRRRAAEMGDFSLFEGAEAVRGPTQVAYDTFRSKLLDNFAYKYSRNRIIWPTRVSNV
jgi:hypothetical protein